MTRTIAIVAALPEELAPLRDCLSHARPLTAGTEVGVYWWGKLGGANVVLAVTGDGQRLAQTGVAAVLRGFPLAGLIAVGSAGALDPNLRCGDVVFAREVQGWAGERLHPPAAVVRATGEAREFWSRVRPGVVVTSDRIADSTAAKQRLAAAVIRASGADGTDSDGLAMVVDLESVFYASAAAAHRVPWAILRAVSDTADETVPALLNRCRDGRGSIQRLRVLGSMLREPGTVPALLRLRSAVRLCGQQLAKAVLDLVPVWPMAPRPDGSLLTMGGAITPGER